MRPFYDPSLYDYTRLYDDLNEASIRSFLLHNTNAPEANRRSKLTIYCKREEEEEEEEEGGGGGTHC
jgi:hypothetical protein